MTERHLSGAAGSILYGGEEYIFPGGKFSQSRLQDLWAHKLAAKGIDASYVMAHAATHITAGDRGPVKRYSLTWEEPA